MFLNYLSCVDIPYVKNAVMTCSRMAKSNVFNAGQIHLLIRLLHYPKISLLYHKKPVNPNNVLNILKNMKVKF